MLLRMQSFEASGENLRPQGALGPYGLEELLGEGAMGVVFRAVRADDGREVALKVMKRELAEDEVFRRRFEHEVRAAAEVSHDHLLPVLDSGQLDGRYYLATRYVGGGSLAEHLRRRGPLSHAALVRLTAQVGSALDALHERGIVHRDVKPGNIMLDGERGAQLGDFGLARGRAYTVLTRRGRLVGTLGYLAPELIRGSPATAATDLYALGCTVYECVAGHPPFADRGRFEIGLAHLEDTPPDPTAERDDLPAWLGAAVVRPLEKEPDARPSSSYDYALGLAGGEAFEW
jgi:serine/threonine-protein kinase